MKVLVFSDSHASLGFMLDCLHKLRPDYVIHLGDYYDDGQILAEEAPQCRLFQVPGNCDRYRCPPDSAQVLCPELMGVRVYMTHGHLHGVKSGIGGLLKDARRCGAQIVLYGHTHRADCHREEDGLWVLNPGTCGYGGSAGLLEMNRGEVISCRILQEKDLEELT